MDSTKWLNEVTEHFVEDDLILTSLHNRIYYNLKLQETCSEFSSVKTMMHDSMVIAGYVKSQM